MEMTITSTDKIVEVNSVPARVWEGASARGIRVYAYITRVTAGRGEDHIKFQQELQEHAPASPDTAGLPDTIEL